MELQLAVTSRQAIETATAAILKYDDVTDDVGRLFRVEKTAASAILKRDDVTEEDGHLERMQKTAARRHLPQPSPKYEVSLILGEVVPIESARSPEQAKTFSRRSEDPSPYVII